MAPLAIMNSNPGLSTNKVEPVSFVVSIATDDEETKKYFLFSAFNFVISPSGKSVLIEKTTQDTSSDQATEQKSVFSDEVHRVVEAEDGSSTKEEKESDEDNQVRASTSTSMAQELVVESVTSFDGDVRDNDIIVCGHPEVEEGSESISSELDD